jgi:hypothetical protein
MNGGSSFANAPGTGGRSKEEIIKQANNDPWQPGSPFTVNTGPTIQTH